jgi:hypothetical protein
LPQDDLQARAIAILKAKNRLSGDDAKLVEEAFAARMTVQGVSSEAPATEEPASAPIAPTALGNGRRQTAKRTPQKGQSPDRLDPGAADPFGISYRRKSRAAFDTSSRRCCAR